MGARKIIKLRAFYERFYERALERDFGFKPSTTLRQGPRAFADPI